MSVVRTVERGRILSSDTFFEHDHRTQSGGFDNDCRVKENDRRDLKVVGLSSNRLMTL